MKRKRITTSLISFIHLPNIGTIVFTQNNHMTLHVYEPQTLNKPYPSFPVFKALNPITFPNREI